MEEIFGGFIEFESQQKLEEFADKLDSVTSMKIIEASIEYGMKQGLFDLDEAYCLHKALSKVKEVKE